MQNMVWERSFRNNRGHITLRVCVERIVGCECCGRVKLWRVAFGVSGQTKLTFTKGLEAQWEETHLKEPSIDHLVDDYLSFLQYCCDGVHDVNQLESLLNVLKVRTNAFISGEVVDTLIGYAELGRICETLAICLRIASDLFEPLDAFKVWLAEVRARC